MTYHLGKLEAFIDEVTGTTFIRDKYTRSTVRLVC
jgi:hypothetical protein